MEAGINGVYPGEIRITREQELEMKGSKKMRKLILMMILATLAAIPAVAEYVELKDGSSYIINDNRYEDDHVWLDYNTINTPGTSFTLNTNGVIGGDIKAYKNSTVIINGGTIGERIVGGGDTKVEIQSGVIHGYVYAGGTGLVDINGGSINGKLEANANGTIKVTGGSIGGIFEVWHDGVIELYGNSFRVGGVNLSVGDSLRDFGTLELLGFGDPFYTGTITGTLSDGSALNNYFQISDWEDGDIVIVPEPATLMLFITGLGAMIIRKA